MSILETLPSTDFVECELHNAPVAIDPRHIEACYVIGSYGNHDPSPDSDLDIAVVGEFIGSTDGLDPLKLTERYHQAFVSDADKPHFNNTRVDFQFFASEDALEDFGCIQLTETEQTYSPDPSVSMGR